MYKNLTKVGYLRLITDFIVILLCFVASMQFSGRGLHRTDYLLLIILLVTWYFATKISNLYDEFRTEKFVGELLLILQNVVIMVLVAGQVFFTLNQMAYARTFVLYFAISISGILILKNYITKKLLLQYRLKGGNTRFVVFVGYNDITENLMDMIEGNPQFGMHVIGVIAKEFVDVDNLVYLGDLKKFFSNDIQVDEIIITTDKLDKAMLQELFAFCDQRAVRLRFVPNFNNFYQSRFQFQLFGNYPLITLRSEPLQQESWRLLKRAFDICFALAVFVGLYSWFFPIMAILIKIDSKGPVFFKQDRWGRNGKKFKCYKFRSMRTDAKDVNEKNEFQQAKLGDPRITKLGAFIRKSSIDELPQFINVLIGDMSVVGPRPHAHEHNLRTKDEIDSYLVRHWVRPGVTGWAQVNGYRGETKTKEEMQNRVDFDIWYIEHWTFWLDIKIIFMTVYNMIRGEEKAY